MRLLPQWSTRERFFDLFDGDDELAVLARRRLVALSCTVRCCVMRWFKPAKSGLRNGHVLLGSGPMPGSAFLGPLRELAPQPMLVASHPGGVNRDQ